MLSEDQEQLETLYEELNKSTNKNIELLKLIKIYHKMVMECEDVLEMKSWAQRMIDHTILVIENEKFQ